MSADVFMSLGDTEAELRPLSAEEYLRAKVEARDMEKDYAADDETRTLLLAACLVARGAYDGENRLFASATEALSALSADELMTAAEEYLPREIKKAEGTEDMYVPSTSAESLGEDAERYKERIEETYAGNAPDTYVREREAAGTPYASWRRDPMSGTVSVIYGGSVSAERPATYAPRRESVDMSAVSDFFERDARRFPGGFEIF